MVNNVEVVSLCSNCKKNPLDCPPALSRKDNKTTICDDCGMQEALSEYYSSDVKKS